MNDLHGDEAVRFIVFALLVAGIVMSSMSNRPWFWPVVWFSVIVGTLLVALGYF